MGDTVIRRDPRIEWITRNRLHPQHASIQASSQYPVRGPSGLIRKNLHLMGFMGPNGIKRIDRANAYGNSGTAQKTDNKKQLDELPLHVVDDPDYYIAVVPDMVGGTLSSHDRDVIGQAHQLIEELGGAGAVVAIVFGDYRESKFSEAGIDRLQHFSEDLYNTYCPEQITKALTQIENSLTPRYWLFPDSTTGGFEKGCRLAATLREPVATQAWKVTVQRTVCRGAGGALDITRSTPRFLLLLEECANPIDALRHEAKPLPAPSEEFNSSPISDLGLMPVDPNAIELAEAEFILAAGNGVDNWDLFHQAAEVLGATEGASRVVVDAGYMPRSRQVGATGTWVTARVYVAVGISGAVQHLQGIAQCDKVIAINTDPDCDMVKRASLSVIGDSKEILAELVQLILNDKTQELINAA